MVVDGRRDSYLPQGSHGLKAVTKYKLGECCGWGGVVLLTLLLRHSDPLRGEAAAISPVYDDEDRLPQRMPL